MTWAAAIGPAIGGIGSLIGGMSSSAAASKAADVQKYIADMQLKFQQDLIDKGDTTAADLTDAYSRIIDLFGGMPFATPDKLMDLMAAIGGEREAGKAAVGGDFLANWGAQQGATSDMRDDYLSAAAARGALPIERVDFRQGVQDQLLDELSRGYLDRFMSEADRSAEQAIGTARTDAERRGLGRSTYALAREREAADFGAQTRNRAITEAIDQALKTAGGRLGLDTGVAQGRMATGNYNLEQALRGSGNELAWLQALPAAERAALTNFLAGRQGSMQELAGLDALVKPTMAQDYGTALSMLGGYGSLRGAALDEASKVLGTPLTMSVGTYQPGFGQTAMAGYSNLFSNYSKDARDNWSGFGDSLNTFFKEFDPKDFSGLFAGSTPTAAYSSGTSDPGGFYR